jgi:hypothetical protein
LNTIDQRILIPTSPDVIWNLISDVTQNPTWQADCRTVSFLTTHHTGQGMRYRRLDARNKEQVIEITAWYDGVGYAYQIVDGTRYTHNRGTIRLQEIAEGTIVQWMFEYELGGFLSGVRNAISTRRSVENAVIESLESLWRVATTGHPRGEQHVSRSLMRDAPDVEQRASYQPRHSSSKPGEDREQQPIIDEPPVTEDDTRPRPAATAPEQPTIQEPDFLADLDEGQAQPATESPAYERFQPPAEPSPAEADDDLFATPPPAEISPAEADDDLFTTPPPAEPSPAEAEDDPFELPRIENDEHLDTTDTAQVSVFDIFGVPKPSETQQMRAVQLDDDTPTETDPEPVVADEDLSAPAEPAPTLSQVIPSVQLQQPVDPSEVIETGDQRLGFRAILRRRMINVRRPK